MQLIKNARDLRVGNKILDTTYDLVHEIAAVETSTITAQVRHPEFVESWIIVHGRGEHTRN